MSQPTRLFSEQGLLTAGAPNRLGARVAQGPVMISSHTRVERPRSPGLRMSAFPTGEPMAKKKAAKKTAKKKAAKKTAKKKSPKAAKKGPIREFVEEIVEGVKKRVAKRKARRKARTAKKK